GFDVFPIHIEAFRRILRKRHVWIAADEFAKEAEIIWQLVDGVVMEYLAEIANGRVLVEHRSQRTGPAALARNHDTESHYAAILVIARQPWIWGVRRTGSIPDFRRSPPAGRPNCSIASDPGPGDQNPQ